NDIHPGQEMLHCSYCGSSLAIETGGGPEHLILPHERNDDHAARALTSLLVRKRLARAKDMKIEFAYVPFVMIEGEKGRVHTMPAPGAPAWALPLPFPPAGNYSFFDPSLAAKEKIVEIREEPKEALRILHIPLYKISYRAAGGKYRAVVTGESLLVQAKEFPPGQAAGLSVPNVLAAAVVFVTLMFAGRLGGNWMARALVVMAAAGAGFTGFTVRRRMVRGG
ncbi:MAG TPA: hypothetical protein VLA34_01670, partial [Candidatus Krumholzibacterium sp.]|nr:hypothetical protein [Candidatus Krumholzibacterium sp.]